MTNPIPEPPVEYAGCPWPIDTGCLTAKWDEYEPSVQERAVALASSTLHRLTAYRVGGCPVTVRPCSSGCAPRGVLPFYGAFGRDQWINPGITSAGLWVNACGCTAACECSAACEIRLPAPVGEIIEVIVDGSVVDPADYAVEDGNALVWRGEGECPWPAYQDMSLPLDAEGTFAITYLNAYPVDMLGAQAAAHLALEFAKACGGKGKCALPAGVTSVVRNGVSFEVASGLFPEGRTGIQVVDGFIELWNPDHRSRQSTVWSPGAKRMRSVPRPSLPPPQPEPEPLRAVMLAGSPFSAQQGDRRFTLNDASGAWVETPGGDYTVLRFTDPSPAVGEQYRVTNGGWFEYIVQIVSGSIWPAGALVLTPRRTMVDVGGGTTINTITGTEDYDDFIQAVNDANVQYEVIGWTIMFPVGQTVDVSLVTEGDV